jgi:hypothetical protein
VPPPPPPAAETPPAAPAPPPAPAPVAAPITGSQIAEPAELALVKPFPVVRISGSYTAAGVRLRLFQVTAPTGVRITVRCAGRGCPYRQRGPFRVLASAPRAGSSARLVSIGGFRGRLLKPGARIQVYVNHPQMIGKYTRFTIRSTRPPSRADSCLLPNRTITAC